MSSDVHECVELVLNAGFSSVLLYVCHGPHSQSLKQ